MNARDHQDVKWGDWVQIPESHDVTILENDVRGNRSRGDCAEYAAVHNYFLTG